MARVLVGGTFDGLHAGHAALIGKAFSFGSPVLVCLTSDAMAAGKGAYVRPYAERKRSLEAFLGRMGWQERALIVMIEDPFSEGMRRDLSRIVVSPETRGNAERINSMRAERGLPAMEIVEVPMVLAVDGKPISDARIRKGEIGPDGSVRSQ